MSEADKSISGLGHNRDLAGASRSQSGRPSRLPEDKDKFKRIVERDERSSSEEDDAEEVAERDSQSIFDLSSKKPRQDMPVQPIAPPASPFDLVSKADAKIKAVGMDREAPSDLTGLIAKDKPDTPTVQGRSFAQVHEDLSSINPGHLTVSNVSEAVQSSDTKMMTLPDRQSLIDQIVAKLYTIKSGDVTDTIMKIKNPPVFEGSELVVTSYNSARGEYNIAFTNLTQEAKQLLDSQRAALLRDLADSGYVAHIVVTTTEPYRPMMAQADPQGQGQNQQSGEGKEGRKGQRGQQDQPERQQG